MDDMWSRLTGVSLLILLSSCGTAENATTISENQSDSRPKVQSETISASSFPKKETEEKDVGQHSVHQHPCSLTSSIPTYELDCRYHNIENTPGVKFCYATACYQLSEGKIKNIQMKVGCDHKTIYSDKARLGIELTLDRFSPEGSATPGLEVFPQGQLLSEGTYNSVLDIYEGRLRGLCYVHPPVADNQNPGKLD
jgi:hypothetical protein